jgi:hypothetical protein
VGDQFNDLKPRRQRMILVVVLFCALGTQAGEADKLTDAKLGFVPPFNSLAGVAATNLIPLTGYDQNLTGQPLAAGDSFTGLITLNQKGQRRSQWLVYLEVQARQSLSHTNPRAPLILHTASGRKIEFSSTPVTVSLRTIGPFLEAKPERKPSKIKDSRKWFDLDEAYLGLGLDRAAEVLLRLGEHKQNSALGLSRKPFSDAEVQKGRESAELLKLTEDDERSVAGAVPALVSYLDVVRHTEDLADILYDLIDKPSLWSVVRQVGVKVNLAFRPDKVAATKPGFWNLPADHGVYHFPLGLEINKKPALNITMVVTRPDSPLLACGGVVGMLAEKPSEPQTYLLLRIVSARRGVDRTAASADR